MFFIVKTTYTTAQILWEDITGIHRLNTFPPQTEVHTRTNGVLNTEFTDTEHADFCAQWTSFLEGQPLGTPVKIVQAMCPETVQVEEGPQDHWRFFKQDSKSPFLQLSSGSILLWSLPSFMVKRGVPFGFRHNGQRVYFDSPKELTALAPLIHMASRCEDWSDLDEVAQSILSPRDLTILQHRLFLSQSKTAEVMGTTQSDIRHRSQEIAKQLSHLFPSVWGLLGLPSPLKSP